MNPVRRTSAAWIAIVAIALQALWPLIAQAKPAVPGMRVAVCTAGGVTHYIELEPGESPLERRSAAHHEHCKLCVFGGERVVVLPPPVVHALVIPVASTDVTHAPALASPESLSYRRAQPRAPPSLS